MVLKRGGKSLDYLEGVIGQVTDEEVEFTPTATRSQVDRDKVAGLIYYRANRRPRNASLRASGADESEHRGVPRCRLKDATCKSRRARASMFSLASTNYVGRLFRRQAGVP